MRTKGVLVGLSLLALGATARAEEPSPTVAASGPTAEAPRQRKLVLGLSFLPMANGKFKFSDTLTSTVTQEAYFAYAIGLSGSYEVLRGLQVGLAPQLIFNVRPKPGENDTTTVSAMKELDIMARVAYAYPLVEGLAVYAQALPGYSLIKPPGDAGLSKGFVVGFDVGAIAEMTDRTFINIGAGYQVGFQSQIQGKNPWELRTRYTRVAIGGGVRF